jgi:hypothetical protein
MVWSQITPSVRLWNRFSESGQSSDEDKSGCVSWLTDGFVSCPDQNMVFTEPKCCGLGVTAGRSSSKM